MIWIARVVVSCALLALGALATYGILSTVAKTLMARRRTGDRWVGALSLCAIGVCAWYATAHATLLSNAPAVTAAITRSGLASARASEERSGALLGWMLDCTGDDSLALIRHEWTGRSLRRVYATDTAANLLGGPRLYSLERAYSSRLREPRNAGEQRQMHPAGQDVRITLCKTLMDTAWSLLRSAGTPAVALVQEVSSGAVLAYTATGAAHDAPLGMRQALVPGSIMKLATAAIWLDNGMDERVMDCPESLDIGRYRVHNAHGFHRRALLAPRDMLVYSCNVVAAQMALEMRERFGMDSLIRGYAHLGFTPHPPSEESCARGRPRGFEPEFWSTNSAQVVRHLSPIRATVCISPKTTRADLAMMAIGQGPIDVSAVHVMRFLQAIGNDGVMLAPTFDWDLARTPRSTTVIMQPSTARNLLQAMTEVVTRGTAMSVASELASSGGWTLAGKTATSERDGALNDDGWFGGLAIAPDGKPRYVVVVYLREGGPGGAVPARIAAALTRYLAEHEPRTGTD